jgi:hypothetical protein
MIKEYLGRIAPTTIDHKLSQLGYMIFKLRCYFTPPLISSTYYNTDYDSIDE